MVAMCSRGWLPVWPSVIGEDLDNLLAEEETHEVEDVDAKADKDGGIANELRGFPPLAKAGAGEMLGVAANAAPPLTMG